MNDALKSNNKIMFYTLLLIPIIVLFIIYFIFPYINGLVFKLGPVLINPWKYLDIAVIGYEFFEHGNFLDYAWVIFFCFFINLFLVLRNAVIIRRVLTMRR